MKVQAPDKQSAAETISPAVLLVGNPNVGKSVLFGALTGRYVVVSNYPGTTVEVSRGMAPSGGASVRMIDTPGVNSLIPMSEDERVTRDIMLNESFSGVVQVADAKNMARALLISVQLAEMEVPFQLALNMQDEARERRIFVDTAALESMLGTPMTPTVATRREGIERLRKRLLQGRKSPLRVQYPEAIEKAVAALEPLLPASPVSRRALALMVLAGDDSLTSWLRDRVGPEVLIRADELIADLRVEHESVGYVIHRARARATEDILDKCVRRDPVPRDSATRTLAHLMTHPVWGWPILLAVLAVMYYFVGKFGAGFCVDFLQNVFFGEWILPHVVKLFDYIPIPVVRDFFVGPYGLITMAFTYAFAIVMPIVATFFIFFGLLEDSGYLPRLAVMLNRAFKRMGLNGKAVLPMVLGLGCGTMAMMTARILGTRRERILVSILLALGVPCSAQLGVILAMLSGISPLGAALWGGVVVGVLFLVGWAAAKVVPGEPAEFIMELPPLRVPVVTNIVIKTVSRIEWYVREAVPLFLLATGLLFFLDRFRVLLFIRKLAAPLVVHWLGLPDRATDAFLIGFLRRDYGAAGLFALAEKGMMDHRQVLVSLVTMTLFVPCIAHFFVMIKERGTVTAFAILAFTLVFAVAVGGLLNIALVMTGVSL